jgi:Ca2+-transporting ATPase
MVFSCLLSANIFLTLVNRSFYYSLWVTIKYKNRLMFPMLGFTLLLGLALLYIRPLATFFEFRSPSAFQLAISVGAGSLSAGWFEVLKWVKRKRQLTHQ